MSTYWDTAIINILLSAGIDFRRHILTKVGQLKTVPTLKELTRQLVNTHTHRSYRSIVTRKITCKHFHKGSSSCSNTKSYFRI